MQYSPSSIVWIHQEIIYLLWNQDLLPPLQELVVKLYPVSGESNPHPQIQLL
jgi:hypothetical protein